VEYAQNKDKMDLIINVAILFACGGSHGSFNRDLVRSREVSRCPSRLPSGTGRAKRRIIGVKSFWNGEQTPRPKTLMEKQHLCGLPEMGTRKFSSC